MQQMRTEIIVLLLVMGAGMSGCSSLSMPSMPWSKSSVPADPSAEALFAEGTRYFDNKSYTRAIDVFQKIKTEHPFSPLLTQTELKLADAYYLNKQYPEAINAFKEFQSLHPTNENIPFVIFRLGQAHFDQFTSIDRDQKNTELAKGYFATVITNYPKSPVASQAREKLAQCIAFLAEHDFNVAFFYYQQEKFPAARDRFEEVVRKYQDTPPAAKSLFYLGESYRKEKNGVKAALAYEALVQHYPESHFAPQARTQLAQLEKEKHDPLAMLLMRDRRPGASSPAPGPQTAQETQTGKLKELNLIAKKDVVYEEPGSEKGFFGRVADTLNPFSSSNSGKKEEKKPESGLDLMVKQKQAEKEKSGGILASLWPFGGKDAKDNNKKDASENNALVNKIDASLKQKGVEPAARQVALNPPAADLPKVDEAPPPATMDTGKLLGKIDSTLEKGGKPAGELPPPPEAAEVFKNPAAAQAMTAKASGKPEPSESPLTSGLLSSIDQKLKSKGVEPSQFELPSPAVERKGSAPKQEQVKNVELEPKLAVEKGPLFLAPTDVPAQEKASSDQEPRKEETITDTADKEQPPAGRAIPKAVVKGPSVIQPAAPAPKPTEQKKPVAPTGQEDETKGILDYLKQDLEGASKVLNPFQW